MQGRAAFTVRDAQGGGGCEEGGSHVLLAYCTSYEERGAALTIQRIYVEQRMTYNGVRGLQVPSHSGRVKRSLQQVPVQPVLFKLHLLRGVGTEPSLHCSQQVYLGRCVAA